MAKQADVSADTFDQEAELVAAVNELKDEADSVKTERLKKNKLNWDLYHGRGKTLHKKKGQSKEFLHKSALAAEQITALFKQSLVNFDKWIDVTWVGEASDELFTPSLAKNLLRTYFEYADMKTVISDAIKVALHEGLATIKLVGQEEVVPRFIAVGAKAKSRNVREWRLRAIVVPAEDYFPDPFPTAQGRLYEIHQIMTDKFTVLDLSSDDGEDPSKPYIKEKVNELEGTTSEAEMKKSRNRGENSPKSRASRRKPVLLDEFHGTVVDRDGGIMKWKRKDGTELELRNVMLTIGNGRVLVQEPIENPRWAATSPFVSAPILRVPMATWTKAIMDAAASLNLTLNELFNLMLDGGLSAVHGIKQLRESWLTPETLDEISDHIPPGTTLALNSSAPQTGKALERVDSGEVPADALAFFNIVNQLFAENVMSNEIKMGGMPQKQVRATEVVASQQAISGIFDGLASDFEDVFIEKLAEQAWMDILQNVKNFPKKDLERLVSPQIAAQILALSPAQRFERAAKGFKWQGKGIRTITQRMSDFQRLMQFLSVVGQNQLLLQEFQLRFSMPKMLAKFMTSLEIDPEEITLNAQEQQSAAMRQSMEKAFLAQMQETKGPGKEPMNPENAEQAPEGEAGSGAGTESGAGSGLEGAISQ